MLSMIESVLLRGGEGGEGEGGRVRCELYKLNVYGEGGLFRFFYFFSSSYYYYFYYGYYYYY